MSKQPNLVYLFFCDGGNVNKDSNGDEKLIFSEPWMNYVTSFIPTHLSFTIAGGINNIDPSSPNKFKMLLFGPDDSVLYTQEGNFNLPEKPNNPSAPPNITFLIDIKNIEISKVGEYKAEIYLDEQELGHQILEIYEKVD